MHALVVHFLDGMWCFVLSGSTVNSINDLIYRRLPIIINSLLSSDELNDVISDVCTSFSWLLRLFIFMLYSVLRVGFNNK